MSEEDTGRISGVSYEIGMKHSFGREEIYQKLLRMFLEGQPGVADEIRLALGNEEIDAAKMQAHSLKSSAATIGAEALSAAAASLEAALRDRADFSLQETYLQDVERQLQKVISGLRQYFSSHETCRQ